jgi:hypothetical protein
MNAFRSPVALHLGVVLVMAAALISASSSAADSGSSGSPDQARQRIGMHIHRAAKSVWPEIPFGFWRLWDAGVSWRDMEKQGGQIDFSRTDLWVRLAETKGVNIVYTFGATPQWASARPDEAGAYGEGSAAEPAHIEDWRRFVRAVATRYKGRIRTYEIWNEPNWKNFYSGDWTTLAELTKQAALIIKEIDPSAKIISSPLASEDGLSKLDAFFATGVGKYVDIIGYHFYTGHRPPEVMFNMAERLKLSLSKASLSGKPIWNTEFGWLIEGAGRQIDPGVAGFSKTAPVYSDKIAASFVARAFLIMESEGVEKSFFYAWDNDSMGIFDSKTETVKPALVTAFSALDRWRNTQQWLCAPNSDGVLCKIKGNEQAAIIWSTNDKFNFSNLMGTWKTAETMSQRVMTLADAQAQPDLGPGPFLVRK